MAHSPMMASPRPGEEEVNSTESEPAAAALSSAPGNLSHADSYASSEYTQHDQESRDPEAAEGPQVPVSFDEAVLRNLCDIDCGLPLLLDRLKQGCSSTKETSNFFRKRAAIEEEYARSSIRLARSSIDSYRESDGKAGSFVTSWSAFLRAHEMLGENHLKLATSLHEMADQLSELTREIERQRRNGKEVGSRLDKVLNDAEGSMDKARVRFDSSVEELERCLVSKAGESSYGRAPEFQQTNPNLSNSHSQSSSSHSLSLAQQAQQPNPPPSKRTFGKAMSKLKSGGKGGFSGRSEDELRSRMAIASDVYRKEVQFCQGVRREHWVVGIPRVLRTLKESSDEVDFGTQFHLSRYSHLFEQTILQDGMTVAPPGGIEDGPGLKAVVEALDSRDDFTKFMEHYTVAWAQSPAGQKGPAKRGDGMLDEDGYALVNHPHQQQSRAPSTGPPRSGSVSSMATNTQASQAGASSSKATFGVGLTDQMDRTGREVPKILEECATVIEEHGADVTGIYRLSGTTSKIQKLKAKLDADVDSVNLSSPENLQDINDITGVLKLWFRELPEPLMTYEGYHGFIEAAKIENSRLCHIRTHERVNDLPDAHYACLKALMGHLDKIQKKGSINSMNISNLAIVFGPTLFRPPPGEEANALADMSWQCKSIETILNHYEAIFVPNEEEEEAANGS